MLENKMLSLPEATGIHKETPENVIKSLMSASCAKSVSLKYVARAIQVGSVLSVDGVHWLHLTYKRAPTEALRTRLVP